MDDPGSRISRLIASEQTLVRKPEAGTKPKLFYIEADQAALVPTEQTHMAGYLWSEQRADPLFQDEQAMAAAEVRARTTYDVAHERPWGWKVSAYLWTKSIAAGMSFLSVIGLSFGFAANPWLFDTAGPQLALGFLAITLALLVFDLKRPERFLSILLRPQWRSWLVIGGYILAAYGALLAAWMAAEFFGFYAAEPAIMWLSVPFSVMAAVYSAFLFRQARGRVFWHSTLTPLHLMVQALVAGASVLIFTAWVNSLASGRPLIDSAFEFLYYELMGALMAHGILIAGELFMPEENVEKQVAARLITRGIFRNLFWGGAVVLGILIPLLALASGAAQNGVVTALVSLLALAGLLLWEHVWVQAGQAVPLS
jgi:formate-dependent nitrite reductase membrane component NrfD